MNEYLSRLYRQAIPTRVRACAFAWSGGRRCEKQSRCYRQACELVNLLRQEYQLRKNTLDERCNAGGPKRSAGSGARLSLYSYEWARATKTTAGGTEEEEEGSHLGDAVLARCLALLDQPDRFLTMRRTTAQAYATIYEAIIQAQERLEGMRHERAEMCWVIAMLEDVERVIGKRYDGCPPRHGETEEQALLMHMGRGVELMARVAKKPLIHAQ